MTISLPGTQGMTFPHGYDEGKALLRSGEAFTWPEAPKNFGGTVDLSCPLCRRKAWASWRECFSTPRPT